ncbi:MAG: hypothetical protein JWQ71_1675 [Pedosphaera sp.]|nr:hypothetical protein [Pedosphaera sp.]
MNCSRFQKQLFEYVEGSLSLGMQAAADRHLAQCSTCRQAVRQEQQMAQFLSGRLQQATETLTLPPHVQLRIMSGLEHKSASPTTWESIIGLWRRFRLPVAISASLLLLGALLLFNYFSGARVHEIKMVRSNDRSALSIEVSYRLPVCESRQEGNFVVDTLSFETVVASATHRIPDQEIIQ